MKILWLATKSPWPANDGGRLLLLRTLEGLAGNGHRITLVAPAGEDPGDACRKLASLCAPILVPLEPRSLAGDALRARLRRRPTTLVRHARSEVRRVVEREIAERPPDLIHVEQLQAFGLIEGCASAAPVVLRAQNVESDLWRGAAEASRWKRSLLRAEAARLERWEGRWLGRCDAVVALTEADRERLEKLCPSVPIRVISAPFPDRLPAGEARDGNPCVVLLANDSWLPNRLGARDFLEKTWPEVLRILPSARLHVFGLSEPRRVPDGVELHAPPADSREVFARNGILVVPLDLASGLRMKILEAWARGLPVVASPAAARGLGATVGRELLVATEPRDFARSLGRLQRDPAARRRLVEAGRARLAASHRPEAIVGELEGVYEEALRRRRDR